MILDVFVCGKELILLVCLGFIFLGEIEGVEKGRI